MAQQARGVEIVPEKFAVVSRAVVGHVCAIATIVISIAVVLGWAFDPTFLKSIFPRLLSMKANTAIGLFCLGICSLSRHRDTPVDFERYLVRVFALIALFLGAATLLEYLLHREFLIDQLLFTDPIAITAHFPAGRLAPATAVSLMLLSISVLLTSNRRRNIYGISQFLIFGAFLISLQALISYVLGMKYVFGVAYYTQMAAHTAVGFVLLCVAQVSHHKNYGLMAILTARSAASRLARTLLLAAILVPPAINWVQVLGQNAGLYDEDFGSLLRVMGNIIFFIVLIWKNSAALQNADAKRESYARELELKNAELEQFARISSHDLKEPLRMVSLYVGRLEKLLGVGKDLEVTSCLTFAKEGAARMNDLVSDMVTYTTVEDVNNYVDTVDCRKALNHALAQLVKQIDDAHAVVETGPMPVLFANQTELTQLFYCLLDNAIKFKSERPLRISVNAQRDHDYWMFSVRDNGIGIEESYENQIFEIFKRLNSRTKYSGNGIGLSMCKKIIDAHHGSIWMKPVPEGGSNFFFTLPAAKAL